MYQPIEKTHQQKLGRYNWFVRRASRAVGSYMAVAKDQEGVYLRLGREPNQKNGHSLAAAVLLDYLHSFSLLSLRLRCGQGFLSPDREVLIDLIPVGEGFKLNDPFLLGQGVGKAMTYRVRLTEHWKQIIIKPIGMTGRLICRIRIPYEIEILPRYADYIDIDSLQTYDTNEGHNIAHHIDQSRSQEVIFPNVRYICNQPSSRMVVTFASINFPSGKYSTYSTFDGISASRLIINDSCAQWYKNGVEGLGGNIKDVSANLDLIMRKLSIAESIFYGMSMGAYGAILFGHMLSVSRIIAINPEVVLFLPQSRSLEHVVDGVHPYPDLKNDLQEYAGDLHLLFSRTDPIDKQSFQLVKQTTAINKSYLVTANHNMSEFMQHYLWLVSLIENGDCVVSGIERAEKDLPI
jgi:hypothetical protein